jgi:peptidoglycan/LPS O-acetylase OafA/YrhL
VTSKPARARPPLRALTGLRFFAALQVVVFHCTAWRQWPVWAPLRDVAGAGSVAVSLFFALSGFILTYAHAGPGAPPIERRAFYVNRFARIYPAYAFALLLMAPLFLVHTFRTEGTKALLEKSAAAILLAQAYVPMFAMAWNPPGWSLSAEWFFYLLFPLVAPWLLRVRWTVAAGVALGCYAFCLAVPAVYLAFLPDAPIPAASESQAFWLNFLRYGPLVRFPEFVIGIVAGRWFLERGAIQDSARWAVASMAALGVIVVTLGCASHIPYIVLHNGLLDPAFVLLIVSLATGAGPLARGLATRPLVALGDASYSLYLIHVPLLIMWAKAAYVLVGPRFYGTPLYTAMFFPIAIAASLLCHRYVELPGRTRVLALLRGRRWASRVEPALKGDTPA